jgi:hypothetical protein
VILVHESAVAVRLLGEFGVAIIKALHPNAMNAIRIVFMLLVSRGVSLRNVGVTRVTGIVKCPDSVFVSCVFDQAGILE